MSDYRLSEEEITKLKEVHKALKDKRYAYKINAIILLGQGYTQEEVANVLLLSDKTIQRCKKIYSKKGIEGLLSYNYQGSNQKLTIEQENKVKAYLETNIVSSSAMVCDYIKKEFNIEYKPCGIVCMLRRWGYSYKKTKIVPSKANEQKQINFVKDYEELRKTLKSTETIYFIDGVHPTHNVMPAYAWIRKGEEREVKSNTGRNRININGAYCPINGKVISIMSDTINAQSTIELFKKIEKTHSDLEKIYIILDNATYYNAKLVKEYLETSKIVCIPLPPYSPNLNLIERLWKFFKKKVLYNKFYESFDCFKDAVSHFFQYGIRKYKKDIMQLLAENFHIFKTI
jgi:transposase